MKKYVKQAVGVCMAMLMAVSAGEYSGMIVQAAENQEAGRKLLLYMKQVMLCKKKMELFITGNMTVLALRAAHLLEIINRLSEKQISL